MYVYISKRSLQHAGTLALMYNSCMSIREMLEKIKSTSRGILEQNQTFVVLVILLVGVIAFGVGRFSAGRPHAQGAAIIQKTPSHTSTAVASTVASTTSVQVASSTGIVSSTMPAKQGAYVASKKGAKYHLPWCSGAQRIIEANKIWFATKMEAEKAGYTPAANCPGI